ncbi:MAG: hydroxyacid dehydrogenase [Parcubacteria group bacterium]|nr:hydroxyacid dehydrogenase [Parcubacteria group bacterium]
MRILNTIGKECPQEARSILKKLGAVHYRKFSQEELVKCISEYDAAVVGLGLTFDKDVFSAAKKLKVIATATTGLDHIDLEEARKKRVEVLSLRGETAFLNTITGTAELAAGLMIDLLRHTPHAFESVKRYEWNRDAFRGHNLYGQTLGIVGLGRLGRWMARYGEAFGMNVIFTDPAVKTSPRKNWKKVSLKELLKQSNVVSIHVHLSPDTENMFSAREFNLMKKNAYLVNTSRGKIVDEKAVLAAFKKKTIAGYATDVLADEFSFSSEGGSASGGETRFRNHPLVEYAKKNQNLIIVPHIGGMTEESREATDIFMAKKISEFFLKT